MYKPGKFCVVQKHSQIFKQGPHFLWLLAANVLYQVFFGDPAYFTAHRSSTLASQCTAHRRYDRRLCPSLAQQMLYIVSPWQKVLFSTSYSKVGKISPAVIQYPVPRRASGLSAATIRSIEVSSKGQAASSCPDYFKS